MKHIWDAIWWLLTVAVIGVIFGFCQYMGYDAARMLIPVILEALGR